MTQFNGQPRQLIYVKGKIIRIEQEMEKIIKSNLSLATNYTLLKSITSKGKTAEGKHKASVINAIRAKIISRCFAVIRRQTPYVSLVA
ncbi:hypothetical protein EZS27_011881 [termite gut metagenome]|uniref:Uncharacterized protein n=1 Tax=termite gut metagenome TaxID=433724 RepID=A0A5J4S3A4_9ZZZZ